MKRRRKRPHRVHLGERGIYIFESRHSPDFHMELVAQDFQHLYVVREGRGFIETERERSPIRENQLVYVPANVAQRPVDDPADPLTLIILCFYENVFGDCSSAVEGLRLFTRTFPALTPFKVGDNYTRLEVRNRLRAIFVEQMQPREGSDSVILSQLIELLVFLSRTYAEHRSCGLRLDDAARVRPRVAARNGESESTRCFPRNVRGIRQLNHRGTETRPVE